MEQGDPPDEQKDRKDKPPVLYDEFNRPVGGRDRKTDENQGRRDPVKIARSTLRVGIFAVVIAMIATAAAVRSCSQGEEGNRMAREALRVNLSWTHDIKVKPCPPDQGSRITVLLKNVGTRPATRVRTHVQAFGSNALCPDKLQLERRLFSEGSIRTINPGEPDQVDVVLKHPNRADMPNLHVFGIAEYLDGLKEVDRKSFYARYQPLDGSEYTFIFCPQSEDLAWRFHEEDEPQGDGCYLVPSADPSNATR